MKCTQRSILSLVIMSQEYEDALAAAGWHVDEFELFMQLSEEHGDGITEDLSLNERMDETPPLLWQAMIDAANEIDLANATIKRYPHMTYAKLKAILDSMSEDELSKPVIVQHPEGGIAPVYGTESFQDCGKDNLGLVASYEDDDAIHPVYMKGVVEHYFSDKDVILKDRQ